MAVEQNPSRALFLDVDGVLNNETWAIEMSAKDIHVYREDILEDRALKLLQEIIERTGALIVVSSAWRRFPLAYEHLGEWLEKYGMTIYDKTPVLDTYRGEEIGEWLRYHPEVTHYAILDDLEEMGLHKPHYVQTSFLAGLTEEDRDRCIQLLTEGVE